jgi:hypothetical protein
VASLVLLHPLRLEEHHLHSASHLLPHLLLKRLEDRRLRSVVLLRLQQHQRLLL